MPNDAKNILGQLIQNADPLKQATLKELIRIRKDQVNEAAQKGIPLETIASQAFNMPDIQSQSNTPQQTPQPDEQSMQQPNVQMLPPKNMLTTAGAYQDQDGNIIIQKGGFLNRLLQNLGGTNNINTDLERMKAASDIKNYPLKQLVEQRRISAEDRRVRQENAANIRNFGGTFNDTDINNLKQDNIDLNSIIEMYGLSAQKDKNGNRTWTIPDMYTLKEMAGRKTITPKEIEFVTDQEDAIDTLKEVVQGLDELGIKDFTKYGKVIPENINSELGPFSLPARFDLIGQYKKDPKYTALKSKLERAFQKYRKIITGAQASNKELNMLRPLISSFTQRPDVFFENTKSLINEGERMLNNRLDLMDASGRDTTKIRDLITKKYNTTSNQTPAQAMYYSKSTGKYYDKDGNEVQ